jgi:hypothetical protein
MHNPGGKGMSFAISPIHTVADFPDPLTLNQKIEIFIARVDGWQIRPALQMKERDIQHRGFAQLAIVISYLEMIGKYTDGYLGERESGKYFRLGMVYTFPDIPPGEKDLLDAFYVLIRNGLYHLGITRPNVMLYDNIPGSFGFSQQNGSTAIIISPDNFVNDLSLRFDVFARELRNPANKVLRRNFEARFDHDNETPKSQQSEAG